MPHRPLPTLGLPPPLRHKFAISQKQRLFVQHKIEAAVVLALAEEGIVSVAAGLGEGLFGRERGVGDFDVALFDTFAGVVFDLLIAVLRLF